MRKYFYIFKTQLMTNLQYITDVLSGFVGYAIFIFILFQLYSYLYSGSSNVINGYTLTQMVWYVVVTEVVWTSLGGRKLCYRISNDVKGGNIAYNVNRPYSYIGYILSSHLGDALVKLGIYSLLGFGIGLLLLKDIPVITLGSIIFCIISILLAIIISIFMITFIGLFSFYIEDSNPFYWMYSKLILVLGTLLPIEFFPKAIQPLLTYLPAYVVSYGPAKLFVDFSLSSGIRIIIAQLIYIFISYGLCLFIYKKGVKRLNVNGG